MVRRQISWMGFLSLVVTVSSVAAQTGTTVPAVETVVTRMAQARSENRQRFRSYVVTREYKLFGKERQNIKSQVTAEVTFVPPDSKKYAFQKSSGAGLAGRIVGRMLESEAEIAKNYGSTDISPNNYDFRFIREEEWAGRRCYVLELNPRRKEKNLVRGNIWVDADTYLVHRTEAEPAKSLSWWVRDVRMVFVYGNVEGMWLQTASEATAIVRILGQHTIVSQDVKYDIDKLFASGPRQASHRDIPRTGSATRHPSSSR
jgi:outer membrane lipoprotein-sorting protein